MVALLRHQPDSAGLPAAFGGQRVGPAPLRLLAGGAGIPVGAAEADPIGGERPHLELVPGIDAPTGPSFTVVVAVALAVFGLFGALRVIQAPSSPTVDGVGGAVPGAVVMAEGDQLVVAGPGDTLWSIATSLSPESDPRPAVAALIDANGGESVQIGQQIVIPARLLD